MKWSILPEYPQENAKQLAKILWQRIEHPLKKESNSITKKINEIKRLYLPYPLGKRISGIEKEHKF